MRFDGKAVPGGLDAPALKQLLTRGWMTHDGMWFAQALAAHGIEEANRMNLAAIRAMAPIEMKRALAALGWDSPPGGDEVWSFLKDGITLFVGDFMEFEFEARGDTLSMDMGSCFAHKGISMLGCIEGYQCGIFPRIYAWLEILGHKLSVEPDDPRCLMHHFGACKKTLRLIS